MYAKMIVVWAMISMVAAGGAMSQESDTIDGDYVGKSHGWRFIIGPYALLASQSTDVGGAKLR